MKIDRYDIRIDDNERGTVEEKDEEGEWCLAADAEEFIEESERLLKENEELKNKIKELKEEIQELVAARLKEK